MGDLKNMFDTIKEISSRNNSDHHVSQRSILGRSNSVDVCDIIVDNTNVKLSFWGSFKAGKTTLINTLINREILPVRATSATGCITRIFYSQKEYAKVIYKDGSVKDILISDIGKYILIKEKNINTIVVRDDILRVDIGLNESVLCSLDIYDLPGDDDDQYLSDLSHSMCSQMDVVFLIMSVTRLFSEKEKDLVNELYTQLKGDLVYVINKMDYIDDTEVKDTEEAINYYLKDKESHNIQSNIHYCSSKNAYIGIERLRETVLQLKNEPYWILTNNIFKQILTFKTK